MYLACCFLLIFLPSFDVKLHNLNQSLQVSQPLFSPWKFSACFFLPCLTDKYVSFNKVKSFLKSDLLKKQDSYSKLKVQLNRLKNVQVVLQHWCKMSWKAMLCVLLPTFKLVLQQIRLLPVAERCCRSTLGKCAKLLFYLFCSNVSKQVVCFCWPLLNRNFLK